MLPRSIYLASVPNRRFHCLLLCSSLFIRIRVVLSFFILCPLYQSFRSTHLGGSKYFITSSILQNSFLNSFQKWWIQFQGFNRKQTYESMKLSVYYDWHLY